MADRAERLIPGEPGWADAAPPPDEAGGVIAIDGNGRIVGVTGGTMALFGADCGDLVGCPVGDLGRLAGNEDLAREIQAAMDSDRRRCIPNLETRQAHGSVVLLATVSPLTVHTAASLDAVRWLVTLTAQRMADRAGSVNRRRGEPLEKPSRFRRIGLSLGGVAIATAILVAALGVWDDSQSALQSGEGAAPRVIVAEPRPIVSRLSVIGRIEPGSVVNVVGPFDGTVQEKLFDYGENAEHGEVLLVMDTSELEVRQREAQVALMKAAQTVEDLRTWGNSPEVARARRGVIAAQLALDETRRRTRDTEALLARGIVPRMEYDDLLQQIKTQELQLAAAKQDLTSTLEKGNPENRRIAELEYENARTRLDDLNRQMNLGIVEAPVLGIILRPPESAAGQAPTPPVEVGSRVSQGQTMFSIASLETLAVTAKVDEVDVNRIQEGQAVEVTGDAFGTAPLRGHIARIAAQASSDSRGSRAASFEVTVEIPRLTDGQRQRIRVGMSSRLSIKLYENPMAIVLPAEAIERDGDLAFVWVHDSQSSSPRQVDVVLGVPTDGGIEVRSGLEAGDRVLVRWAEQGGPSRRDLPLLGAAN